MTGTTYNTTQNNSLPIPELTGPKLFTVGTHRYVLGPAAPVRLQKPQQSGPVILVNSERLKSTSLHETLACWSEKDDVFNEDPRWRVVVVGSDIRAVEESNDASYYWDWPDHETRPQEGPYYILGGRLFPAWRLYTDTHKAFVLATQPQSDSNVAFEQLWKYEATQAGFSDLKCSTIAVPSRIPFLSLDTRPLNGLRVALKDNIDLKGVPTGLSSKAWQEHYPEKIETSPLIRGLMDAGAVVVGKTKLCQFGVLEFPTAEWIDVHPPWNPRGDKYLSPGGSTAGGAAALAAYDWLDISIGTDTAGSIRKPAAHNGLFALRPTTPPKPIEGIFPLAPVLDAPGFLARDIDTLIRVAEVSLPHVGAARALQPRHIHVIENASHKPEDNLDNRQSVPNTGRLFDADVAEEAVIRFIQDLMTSTQAELTVTNDLETMFYGDPDDDQLQQLYHDSQVPGHDNLIHQIISEEAVETIKCYDLFQRLKAFTKEYRAAHGEDPYYNPVTRHVMATGRKISEAKYKRALRLKAEFAAWFTAELQDSIAIYHIEPRLEHRDSLPDPPESGPKNSNIPNSFISPLAGCPEVIIPIDQIPYPSKVTGNVEFVPLVVAIMGPPHSDLQLLRFAKQFLETSGRPTKVKTGKLAFDEHPGLTGAQQRARSFDLCALEESFLFNEDWEEEDSALSSTDEEWLGENPDTEVGEIEHDPERASGRWSLHDRSPGIGDRQGIPLGDSSVADDLDLEDKAYENAVRDDSGFVEGASGGPDGDEVSYADDLGVGQDDDALEEPDSPTCCSYMCLPFRR